MLKNFIKSVYEKVYIINFEHCSHVPSLTKEELTSLGKWYVSTGKEWICHSDYEFEEFQKLFLNFVNADDKDNISFESDFMPFQHSYSKKRNLSHIRENSSFLSTFYQNAKNFLDRSMR